MAVVERWRRTQDIDKWLTLLSLVWRLALFVPQLVLRFWDFRVFAWLSLPMNLPNSTEIQDLWSLLCGDSFTQRIPVTGSTEIVPHFLLLNLTCSETETDSMASLRQTGVWCYVSCQRRELRFFSPNVKLGTERQVSVRAWVGSKYWLKPLWTPTLWPKHSLSVMCCRFSQSTKRLLFRRIDILVTNRWQCLLRFAF